jgi:hypothetical protein
VLKLDDWLSIITFLVGCSCVEQRKNERKNPPVAHDLFCLNIENWPWFILLEHIFELPMIYFAWTYLWIYRLRVCVWRNKRVGKKMVKRSKMVYTLRGWMAFVAFILAGTAVRCHVERDVYLGVKRYLDHNGDQHPGTFSRTELFNISSILYSNVFLNFLRFFFFFDVSLCLFTCSNTFMSFKTTTDYRNEFVFW